MGRIASMVLDHNEINPKHIRWRWNDISCSVHTAIVPAFTSLFFRRNFLGRTAVLFSRFPSFRDSIQIELWWWWCGAFLKAENDFSSDWSAQICVLANWSGVKFGFQMKFSRSSAARNANLPESESWIKINWKKSLWREAIPILSHYYRSSDVSWRVLRAESGLSH